MKLSKAEEVEYRARLSAGRGELFGIALIALLEHELERVKEAAITPGNNIATLQGEAAAYKTFLKFLKERPVTTKQV